MTLRRLVFLLLTTVALQLPTGVARGADGESLFHDNGCAACHKPDRKRVGPSLQAIAAAYRGKPEALAAFLKGNGEPIVDPERFKIMQQQMEPTLAMTDEERSAVAAYLLSFE